MRQLATGSDQRFESAFHAMTSGLSVRRLSVIWVLVAGLSAPVHSAAQNESAKNESPGEKGAPTATVPLGQFVPKENLILYVEFAGLDATATSWKGSAAYRMLNETPLGAMMEEVTVQLVEKTLGLYPGHRLSGSEILTLVKHSAKSGWVLAIHASPKSADGPLRGTLVLRGGAGKELRSISGRAMGWMMGDVKPKIERRAGRTMVIVPSAAGETAAPATGSAGGWAWWAEKDDLAIAFWGLSSVDSIIAALDGKTPNVLEHPSVAGLLKPEGAFQPVCAAFADTANCPAIPTRLTELLHTMGTEWGAQRIDARLGFEGNALVTVTRVAAPKPRKGLLAAFDQPTFEKSAVLPLPTGVDSFLALSMNPAHLLEAVYAADSSDAIKSQVEEVTKAIRRGGKIDLEKDILAHLGPKMVVFLAPERSAAANDESLESALKKGLNLLALTSAVQSLLPKVTVVAEVDNPESFGKALDAVVIALNNALKARAHDLAEEEREGAGEQPEDGARARAPGGRGGAAGARAGRRRQAEETPAPHFTPILGQENAYVLTTPRDSLLKLGASHFRPTIQLDGKYLVISTASDAVRTAIAAIKKKDSKPSDDVQKACEGVPNQLMALGVNDVRDGLSSVLASWPGTLQATINTAIALSKPRSESDQSAQSSERQPGRGPGLAGRPLRNAQAGAAGVLGRAGLAGGAMAEGERGQTGRPGGPGNAPGGPGGGAAEAGAESMVQFNIDADKLPKADDLKKSLSPSIAFISLSDDEVRFTTRTAFPNFALPINLAPLLASTPLGQRIRQALAPAQAASPDQTPAASAGASPGATAAPPGGQPGPAPAAPPGGRRGGRRDRN